MFCNHCSTFTAEHPWAMWGVSFSLPYIVFALWVGQNHHPSCINSKYLWKLKLHFCSKRLKAAKTKLRSIQIDKSLLKIENIRLAKHTTVCPQWNLSLLDADPTHPIVHSQKRPKTQKTPMQRKGFSPNPPNCPLTKKTDAEKRIFKVNTKRSYWLFFFFSIDLHCFWLSPFTTLVSLPSWVRSEKKEICKIRSFPVQAPCLKCVYNKIRNTKANINTTKGKWVWVSGGGDTSGPRG